jgi:hypothetical protein
MLLQFATIWEQLPIILVLATSGPPQLFINQFANPRGFACHVLI